MNQILFSVSVMCLVILLLMFLLKRLNQPYMVAYILAGVLIGPFAGKMFVSTEVTASLGEIGILLLMFFLGMEIDIPDRRSLLIKPVIAQGMKIMLGVGFAIALGMLFHWQVYNILLLSVVFVFNSTAVVSEYLSKNGESGTVFGKSILNILLLQDILLAPVLTLFQFINGGELSVLRLLSAIGSSVVIFALLGAARNRQLLRPRFLEYVKDDHELQVFLGGFLCLGMGLLAEAAGMSGAIGSFVAGMLIGRTPAFHWLENSLKPFRVFFVSFFFMSIGLRLDVSFIAHDFPLILTGTLLILLSNSLLSALVFRLLRYSWKNSLYGGALLSQVGEFGILACSLAHDMHIIGDDFFKTGVAITALSLLFSTTWITVLREVLGWRRPPKKPSLRGTKQPRETPPHNTPPKKNVIARHEATPRNTPTHHPHTTQPPLPVIARHEATSRQQNHTTPSHNTPARGRHCEARGSPAPTQSHNTLLHSNSYQIFLSVFLKKKPI